MFSTKDFEFLLDKQNVLSVVYDEQDNLLEVEVSHKFDDQELPDGHSVREAIDRRTGVPAVDVDVEDAGYGETKEAFDLEVAGDGSSQFITTGPSDGPLRQQEQRPIPAGISEAHGDSSAGTGAVIARVTDTSSGVWGDNISQGQLVRLSNNHVFAEMNKADPGESIVQPGPYDGGNKKNHTVGELAGYVEIEEGCKVDVAARTTNSDRDAHQLHALPNGYGTDVHSDGIKDLKGKRLTKTGRTTGVLEGAVKRVGATARINYGGDLGVVTLRDQIVCHDMSTGGDSGSPVFVADSGELAGLVFAGSPSRTIINYIGNVQKNLGVSVIPTDDVFDVSIRNGVTDPDTREVAMPIVVDNNGLETSSFDIQFNSEPDRVITDSKISAGTTVIYITNMEPGERARAMAVYSVSSDMKPGDSSTKKFDINSGNYSTQKTFSYTMVDNLWKWVDNRSNDNDSLDLGDMTAAYSMYNKGRLTKAQAESVIHRMFEGWKLDPRDWEQN